MPRDAKQMPGPAPLADETPYERIVEELDGVVRQLESGELSLEDSLRAFERGVQLAQAAERRLDSAEQRVELLLQGDRTQPLPPMESAEAPRATAPARQPRAPAPSIDDEDIPF